MLASDTSATDATKEDADAMVQGGMEEGARETYERLEEVLAKQKRAA